MQVPYTETLVNGRNGREKRVHVSPWKRISSDTAKNLFRLRDSCNITQLLKALPRNSQRGTYTFLECVGFV